MEYPKISVITPSYNQGQFLEETIISVIGQCYPNLEYIIMDGGSKDNSVDIIKKYEKFLTYWVSAKDGGQAAAINEGFSRATGDILCWLNSDDTFLPGILHHVAAQLNTKVPTILFGNTYYMTEGKPNAKGTDIGEYYPYLNLEYCDYITQPSSFWNKEAWQLVGPLVEKFNYIFDWEWFIRAKRAGVVFLPTVKYLSVYRHHPDHKTGTGGDKRNDEIALLISNLHGKSAEDLFTYMRKKLPEIRKTNKFLRRMLPQRLTQVLLRRVFFRKMSHFDWQMVNEFLLSLQLKV
jgi:glycosyltransferase involved in cell wall biosynthesis